MSDYQPTEQEVEAAARAIRDAVKICIRPGGETMRLLEKGHAFALNSSEAEEGATAALIAAHAARIVTTVDQLDALPIGSAVLDAYAAVCVRLDTLQGALGWRRCTTAIVTGEHRHGPYLPVKVLHYGADA